MKIKFASRASFAWTNVVLVAVLLTITAALLGQTFYGSIVGTVTDATGAAAPGSGVTLINLGTSERRTAETDALGNYQFVNLVPGPYRIDIQRVGFKRLTRDPSAG
jgi:Carboxypeptidase regulatory-like domain